MSRILYGSKQLPLFLDAMEEDFPLKHRELHLENNDDSPVHCQVYCCEDGHIHYRIAPLAPTSFVLLAGIYAYTFALILDSRKQLPKRPSKARIARVMEEVEALLDEYDSNVALAFDQHKELLGGWICDHIESPGLRADPVPDPSSMIGVLGLPLQGGEA